MITKGAHIGRTAWTRIGAVLVAGFFCLPLFVGLGNEDLRNDEAIYSYSVDRILETGEWGTPRAIPFDGPFLEKPPLKVWLVAGLIRTGLVPHDERGLRAIDALFGALSFLYVYGLGCLLAGPVCGVVAVLVLFTFDPLLLEHGLRSNNMEAALLLSYCGGLYHFSRWTEDPSGRGRAAAHAFAVGGYIALGFMTKFVAVFFLPLICALAFAWRRDAWARGRTGWRAWIGPALLTMALCVPWFVFAWMRHGRLLWDVMLGQHVYTRFTGALDPAHLQPWSFYLLEIWHALARAGSHWVVAAGFILLAVWARAGRPWLARLVILWFVVPVALISFGTSKLFHYAYPFVPPLALGAGAAVAALVAAVTSPAWRSVLARLPVPAAAATGRAAGAVAVVRRGLVVVAVVAFALALWTAMEGPVRWEVGVAWFRNTSITRPIIVGSVLLWLGAVPASQLYAWALVPLLVVLAAPAYGAAMQGLAHRDQPLSTLRDCALEVQRTNAGAGRAVYNAAQTAASHPYYYYLRALGPVTFAIEPAPDDVRLRLVAGLQPTLVSRDDLGRAVAAASSGRHHPRGGEHAQQGPPMESRHPALTSVARGDGVVVILPGPYSVCAAPAVAAGWEAVHAASVHGVAQ